MFFSFCMVPQEHPIKISSAIWGLLAPSTLPSSNVNLTIYISTTHARHSCFHFIFHIHQFLKILYPSFLSPTSAFSHFNLSLHLHYKVLFSILSFFVSSKAFCFFYIIHFTHTVYSLPPPSPYYLLLLTSVYMIFNIKDLSLHLNYRSALS